MTLHRFIVAIVAAIGLAILAADEAYSHGPVYYSLTSGPDVVSTPHEHADYVWAWGRPDRGRTRQRSTIRRLRKRLAPWRRGPRRIYLRPRNRHRYWEFRRRYVHRMRV